MAQQASHENCMVVLPTGLGKTAVALQVIAKYLAMCDNKDSGMAASSQKDDNKNIVPGAVLFLAPTRVLANQHYDFVSGALTIDDVSLVTGEDSITSRKKMWNASVICATPEITRNDLVRGMITPEMFGLVIFDEAHRTVGDYAYSGIAELIEEHNPLILGMTATLPSDREKATEIMARLRIARVSERSESSADVSPYIQDTKTEQFSVDLTPELKKMQELLRNALQARCRMLRSSGVSVDLNPSLSSLLRQRDYVLEQRRVVATPLFTAIRIHYALSILESHGVMPFLKFCERTGKKKGKGIRELFEVDPNFTRALGIARDYQKYHDVDHPKLGKLKELLKSIDGKVLIFTSYRDSVDMVCNTLDRMGIKSGKLIGKAGQTGLKQKQQIETVRRFRDGEFRVMVATRVGEEGLDIAEVNHVIFYDNVPSSIRYVQRRGRTGRKAAGRLIVLIAKGTIDEAYHWIGRRKIKAARTMGDTMSNLLEMNNDAKHTSDTQVAVAATATTTTTTTTEDNTSSSSPKHNNKSNAAKHDDPDKIEPAKNTGLDVFM